MLNKAWVITDDNQNIFSDNLLMQILSSRGIVGDENIEKFLNPSIKEYMPDPNVLTGMDDAARIIADNVLQKNKIVVYGDYDVDGITSTGVFVKYLREIGADVVSHLPTREGEGYGLNVDAIDTLFADGAKLLITVDCGISGVDEVAHAKSLGMTVVITDHHSPDVTLPNADAIVNPKQPGDTSGMTYLAGVGVAFLTVVALHRELKNRATAASDIARLEEINLLNYLDFVALGTICDTMPLIGLNRAFVATGLKVLALRKNIGLRALMDVAEIKSPTTYAIMFSIGPRLNAAGRLDSAAPVLELLLTDNILIANDLANKLNRMNTERIDVQNAIMIDAMDMAQKCRDSGRCSLFICGDNWRSGVIGIIAGRLKDKYCAPTCVATKSDGIIDGSGRSIPGVDLGKIIHDALARGIITSGGGHAAAAGFSLNESREQEFCEFMEKSVLEQLNGQVPEAEIAVDAELDGSAANIGLINKLAKLEPFGQSNPEPTLVLHGITLAGATTMGKGNTHLRGTVNTGNGSRLAFVGFNMTATPIGNFLLDDSNTNTKITMLGKLKENEYNGRITPQFILEDLVV